MKNNFKSHKGPPKGQFSRQQRPSKPSNASNSSNPQRKPFRNSESSGRPSFNRANQPKQYKQSNQLQKNYRQGDRPNYSSDNSFRSKSDTRYNRDNPARANFRNFSKDKDTKPRNNFGYSNKSNNPDKKPYFKKDNRDSRNIRDNRDNRDNNQNRQFSKFNKSYSKFPKNNFNKPVREKHTDVDVVENKKIAVPEEIKETGSMTFGRNAVLELLKVDATIDKIFVQANQREGSITKIVAEAVRKSIPVIEVEKSKLDKMISGSSHQGVVALTSEIEYCSVDDIMALAEEKNEKPFILIADKIMDAQNLGAIIRSAECAGVHGIIIPKRNAAGVSSVVSKVSAGAVFHIKIAKVANIAATVENLKEQGVWVFASTSDTLDSPDTAGDDNNGGDNKTKKEIKNYYDADYNLPLCLVVGNEGEGLSPIILQKSDFLINIPMYGKIESLNVSCATAVLLYEIKKQRR